MEPTSTTPLEAAAAALSTATALPMTSQAMTGKVGKIESSLMLAGQI
jgi:hypothetical protein